MYYYFSVPIYISLVNMYFIIIRLSYSVQNVINKNSISEKETASVIIVIIYCFICNKFWKFLQILE